MEVLFDKEWLDEQLDTLPLWKQKAYRSFSSIIADDENTYPCVPGRQGFLSNNLRFSFIGDPREVSSAKELANSLKEYGAISRDTGKYASLAVFVETPNDILESYGVEDYQEMFWTILNNVTLYDQKEWPEDIPTDPSDTKWEFCFDGEPYFAFCATPAHEVRRSRHFPCLLLAFQPRWVFNEINDSTVFGRKMKKLIRKRLVEYDGIPGHPDLKWYGQEDNHEWKQYFLSDDDSSPSKCPFMRMKNKFSNFSK
ncbi:FPC/CPF motif-containing protein YcgG [Bacillus mesophilus]|uniref:YqcI/YcgG family protein n=1 Tax=Bacillus mesophilus TaxID=1808955 RepID=A0A6M0QCA0_9BACI|nr:FPC/CPF motif-containing protein YcgG [Bacillus mesophilus]NEY73925.1 YqcI/YcgG family protein [Bacillus mesophilus]